MTALSLSIIACATGETTEFQSQCGHFELQGEKPLTFYIDNPKQATLDGVICSGSFDSFNELISHHPNIETFNIDMIEGSLDDETNMVLSKAIHDHGINTHLNEGGLIASGGVDLYLAGVYRSAHDHKPKMGVHSWGEPEDGMTGDTLVKSHPIHNEYLNYYRYIGINQEFYWFTLAAAPAEDMHWMTLNELKKFNVINMESHK
jgi:hypothetical protein